MGLSCGGVGRVGWRGKSLVWRKLVGLGLFVWSWVIILFCYFKLNMEGIILFFGCVMVKFC